MAAVSGSASVAEPSVSGLAAGADRLVHGLIRHWLLLVNLGLGIWTGLPWLAPAFMRLGWSWPARLIYFVYGLFCHQLPQRSWFLFGARFSPSLAEIQAAGGVGADFLALRRFLGTPELGWKVAWSDRMVSFYGGWFLFGLLYALLRGRIRGLRWQTALALILPLAVDGTTHMISDLWGVTAGFRQSNAWLAVLTGNGLPPTFYAGDAWGSFNSLARLVTGLLAAFGLIFWLWPVVDRTTDRSESQ
ncbi:MAG: DUF2085 domain-containing protein [Anaerolineae bacterium]